MRFVVQYFRTGRDHPFLNDENLYRIIDTETRTSSIGCWKDQSRAIEIANKKNKRHERLVFLNKQLKKRKEMEL